MRSALIFAAALATLAPAIAMAATPDPAADKTALDVRCIVVGGALSQSDDADLQSLGRASLFYFLGRLEGRGRHRQPRRPR